MNAGCFTRPERHKKHIPHAQCLSVTWKICMHAKIKRAEIASDEPPNIEGTTAHGSFVLRERPAKDNVVEIFSRVEWP